MTESEMKQRTKAFALRIIKLANTLSKDFVGRRLGDQLLRSGTSVAANYRSACRARSKADFVSKLGIVEEEADESKIKNSGIQTRAMKQLALANRCLN